MIECWFTSYLQVTENQGHPWTNLTNSSKSDPTVAGAHVLFYLLPGIENSAGGIGLVGVPHRRRCAPLKA